MRTHSQAPINQDPCACLLGHWFPRQAVYLSCDARICVCVCVCMCVCVCVCVLRAESKGKTSRKSTGVTQPKRAGEHPLGCAQG